MEESGNQQERPSLAWAGGLVQGEGCFCLTISRHRKNRYRVTPLFSLGMTDKVAIERLISDLKQNDLPVLVVSPRRHYSQGKGKWKDVHTVHVSGFKRLARYVQALKPYLVGDKLRSAELLEQFINIRMGKPKGSPYEDEEVELVKAIRDNNGGGQKYVHLAEFLKDNEKNHNRYKTHCKNGHELAHGNIVRSSTGARRCKICYTKQRNEWQRQHRAQNQKVCACGEKISETATFCYSCAAKERWRKRRETVSSETNTLDPDV